MISIDPAMKGVIGKLQSQESAHWCGFLSPGEFVMLLDIGAVAKNQSEGAAAREQATAGKGRTRWYTFTPGHQLRSMVHQLTQPKAAPAQRDRKRTPRPM